MKALQITKPGSIKVSKVTMPEYGKEDILIRVNYVGFCGSDLSTYLGKNPLISYPRIPGHEISGTIEQTGETVPASFTAGSAVTVIPYTNCGECPSCKRGRYNACQFNKTMGVQRDGAMQEYIAVPWKKVLVEPNLSLTELAMIEPLTVGFHAIERGRVEEQDTVVVFGCGMIGIGAIIGASRKNARVVAVDIDDKKLGVVKNYGVQHTINSAKEDLHKTLSDITNQEGADVTIEAVGNPQTYVAAINEAAFSGRVVCIGYTKNEVPLATRLFVQKELDIMGSRNATPDDFRNVGDYLRTADRSVQKLISRVTTFEGAAEAVKDWAKQPEKTIKLMLKVH